MFDERVVQHGGVGCERHINTGIPGGAYDLVDLLVQQWLALAGIHDALDAEPTHFLEPFGQPGRIEHTRLVADVIHGTEGAAMVAGAYRGELHVDGIDLLSLLPVITRFEQLRNSPGVIDELMAIDTVEVGHDAYMKNVNVSLYTSGCSPSTSGSA